MFNKALDPNLYHLPTVDDWIAVFNRSDGIDMTLCKSCSKVIFCLEDGAGYYCKHCWKEITRQKPTPGTKP